MLAVGKRSLRNGCSKSQLMYLSGTICAYEMLTAFKPRYLLMADAVKTIDVNSAGMRASASSGGVASQGQ